MLWKFAVALLAIATIFGFNNSAFGFMGEKLTFYLRAELYEETLHKQISWFDRESHAPGVITSVTSENVVQLNGLSSEFIGTLAETILMMGVSIVGGIVICW